MTLTPDPGFECPTCQGEGAIIVNQEGKREPCPNMLCRGGRVADPHRDGLD